MNIFLGGLVHLLRKIENFTYSNNYLDESSIISRKLFVKVSYNLLFANLIADWQA